MLPTFIVLSIPLVAMTQSYGWHCIQLTTVQGKNESIRRLS